MLQHTYNQILRLILKVSTSVRHAYEPVQTRVADDNTMSLAYIQPRQLDNEAENDNVILLDVRPAEDFNREHIVSSINIPCNEIAGKLHLLPLDKKLVLVCRDGHIARKAAYKALEMGRSPFILDGGILCFKSARYRIERTRESGKAEKQLKMVLALGGITSLGMVATGLGIGLMPAIALGLMAAAFRNDDQDEQRH